MGPKKDKIGLCRGTVWHAGYKRSERCMRPGEFKHITPHGHEYWLCLDCEGTMMHLLDQDNARAINQFIFGGSRTTGII